MFCSCEVLQRKIDQYSSQNMHSPPDVGPKIILKEVLQGRFLWSKHTKVTAPLKWLESSCGGKVPNLCFCKSFNNTFLLTKYIETNRKEKAWHLKMFIIFTCFNSNVKKFLIPWYISKTSFCPIFSLTKLCPRILCSPTHFY